MPARQPTLTARYKFLKRSVPLMRSSQLNYGHKIHTVLWESAATIITPISPEASVLCCKPSCPRNHGGRKHPAITTYSNTDHCQRKRCWGAVIQKEWGKTPISVQKYMNGTKQNNAPPLEANKSLPSQAWFEALHENRCSMLSMVVSTVRASYQSVCVPGMVWLPHRLDVQSQCLLMACASLFPAKRAS